jgi:hypothetical protein
MSKLYKVLIILGIVFLSIILASIIVIISKGNETKKDDSETIRVEIFSSLDCTDCEELNKLYLTILNSYSENEVEILIYFNNRTGDEYQALVSYFAAKEQDQGDEYLEHLINNAGNYSQAELSNYAESIELDIEKFEKDINNIEILAKVENFLDEISMKNISTIPTVLINNRGISDLDEDSLIKEINEQLD